MTTTPTTTDEILDLIAAKTLTTPVDYPHQVDLCVEAVLANYDKDVTDPDGCYAGGDEIVVEIHSFVLAGLPIEVPGGVEPFDLLWHLTTGLAERGVKWDTEGREFGTAVDVRVNVPYAASFSAPITRASSGHVKDLHRGRNGHWFWTFAGKDGDRFYRTDSDGTGLYEHYQDDETSEQEFEDAAFDIGSCSPATRLRRIVTFHTGA